MRTTINFFLVVIIFTFLIGIATADSSYCTPTPNNLDTTNITISGSWVNITIYSDPECWVWYDAGYGDVVGYPCASLAPVASFTSNVTCGIIPFPVQFVDTTIGLNITDWYWDFADGNSTLENPIHWYNSTGVYGVDHSANSSYGTGWSNLTGYITARAIGDTCAGGDEYDSDHYTGNWFTSWWI
jgi:PKD repeat protein